MNEMAVFTEAIAEELVNRGFRLVGYTNKAWFFEDSVLLERAVCELVEALQELGK
jgi:hypothetical protein